MKKTIAAFAAVLFLFPSVSMASTFTQPQINAIIGLLRAFNVTQLVIDRVLLDLTPNTIHEVPQAQTQSPTYQPPVVILAPEIAAKTEDGQKAALVYAGNAITQVRNGKYDAAGRCKQAMDFWCQWNDQEVSAFGNAQLYIQSLLTPLSSNCDGQLAVAEQKIISDMLATYATLSLPGGTSQQILDYYQSFYRGMSLQAESNENAARSIQLTCS